jgi:hypothetical protein
MPKKTTRKGFPMVIYVRKEEDGGLRYFTADKDPAVLMHGVGDRAQLARTAAPIIAAEFDRWASKHVRAFCSLEPGRPSCATCYLLA